MNPDTAAKAREPQIGDLVRIDKCWTGIHNDHTGKLIAEACDTPDAHAYHVKLTFPGRLLKEQRCCALAVTSIAWPSDPQPIQSETHPFDPYVAAQAIDTQASDVEEAVRSLKQAGSGCDCAKHHISKPTPAREPQVGDRVRIEACAARSPGHRGRVGTVIRVCNDGSGQLDVRFDEPMNEEWECVARRVTPLEADQAAATQDALNAARKQQVEQRVWDDAWAQSIAAESVRQSKRLSKIEQRLDAIERPRGDAERVSHDDLFGKPWPTAKDVAERVEQPSPNLGPRDSTSRAPEAATRGDDEGPCAFIHPRLEEPDRRYREVRCCQSRTWHDEALLTGRTFHRYVAPEPAPAPSLMLDEAALPQAGPAPATEAEAGCCHGFIANSCTRCAVNKARLKTEADLAETIAARDEMTGRAEAAEARVRDLKAKIEGIVAAAPCGHCNRFSPASCHNGDGGAGIEHTYYQPAWLTSALGEEQPNG